LALPPHLFYFEILNIPLKCLLDYLHATCHLSCLLSLPPNSFFSSNRILTFSSSGFIIIWHAITLPTETHIDHIFIPLLSSHFSKLYLLIFLWKIIKTLSHSSSSVHEPKIEQFLPPHGSGKTPTNLVHHQCQQNHAQFQFPTIIPLPCSGSLRLDPRWTRLSFSPSELSAVAAATHLLHSSTGATSFRAIPSLDRTFDHPWTAAHLCHSVTYGDRCRFLALENQSPHSEPYLLIGIV